MTQHSIAGDTEARRQLVTLIEALQEPLADNCTSSVGFGAVGGWGRRARGGVTWPRPMEHEAQPEKSDQHQLGKKDRRPWPNSLIHVLK